METTVWSAISDLINKKDVDIGRPIKNINSYMVDDKIILFQKDTKAKYVFREAD